MYQQAFGKSSSYSTMSTRPISLDLDHAYNHFNGGSMKVSPVNSNNFVHRRHERIDLDHHQNSPDAEFEFDDLTTTSGSELLAHEAYMEAKRNSRRRIHHNYYRPINDSSDSEGEMVYSPRRRQPRMEMIQEISPVLAETSDNDDHDLPPRMPLKFSKGWNPVQTSTTTSMRPQHNHRHNPRPKTNPRHSAFGTPSSYRSIDLDGEERIPSLFDNQRQPVNFGLYPMLANRFGITGIIYLEMSILQNILSVKIRNAVFFDNLCMILNHQVNSYVKVNTKRDPKKVKKRQHYDDIRFESFKTKTVRKTNSPKFFEIFKFKISNSRNLDANDYLSISVYTVNDSSSNPLSECVGCMAFPLRRLFEKAGIYDRPVYGKRHKRSLQDSGMDEATSVINGGYFLLPQKEGSRKHFHESQIRHTKYYDDIGAPSIRTTSSAMSNSPIKMMGETNWGVTTPSTVSSREQVLTRFGASKNQQFAQSLTGSSCYQTSKGSVSSGIPKKRSSLTGAMVNGNDLSLSSPSTSSSNSSEQNGLGGNRIHDRYDFSTSHSSSSTSGLNAYKRGAHKRYTLPSIMTTSDSNSEFSEPFSLDPIDHHFLYADDPPLGMAQPPPTGRRQRRLIGSLDSGIPSTREEYEDENEDDDDENDGIRFKKIAHREVQQDVKVMGLKMGIHPAVRRVASFSSPPTKAEAAKAAAQQREQRKGFLGKTLHFLRTKVDGSSSQSSLVPTRDEVISWQDKMENLLENKFGAVLFGEFLAKEYSKENLDFCLKCREYKKLFQNEKKNAKKIARLAKEIDDEFLCDHAPNEVNLEASVKSATRAAKNDVLKSDTFSLAQNKIEQLIANDKYQRFLKSSEYQNLLQSVSLGSQSSIPPTVPEVPFIDSDGSTTPCQTSNDDTPLAPQYRTLRSASALETLGNIATIDE